MNPLLYCLLGVAGGVLLAAFVLFLTRRDSKIGPLILGKIELLERAQEREEKVFRDELARNREENANAAKSQREELTASLESVRGIVDLRLQELQKDNAQQIERMRATVDEKLQGTLEKRLGESFKLVSERLEKVHQGLGAMQQLASDVGGLQRVLTNVKTRGGWGEVQLGALLEQLLTSEQFDRNVQTRDESGERVDYAIKLPGEGNGARSVAADRRQISDGRLSATNYGTGKRRFNANRQRDERFGNPAEKIGERYLREIY